ncbi:uncharacterized protein SCHCODRAFT_02492281 [Schizophyllum commune H4-8]|nr:uncharacterized protein SCHCODRAFT_02492281 [Schizophyllum commune H4-8]KAI5896984.1 hypothetical protein SCHCODRAFT_02492281 [Schizophyllum commune H4-8]
MSLADSRHAPGSDRSHAPLINDLPAELLSSIFEWYMFPGEPGFFGDYFPEVPLVVSHVCRLWRETALDLPFMWRRILVKTCQNEGRYLLAQMFLQRTKDQTIALCYSETGCKKDHRGKPCTAAIEFVIRNIGQLHSLILEDIEGETLSCLSKIPGDAASRLSCLVVTVDWRCQAFPPVTMQAALSPLYRAPSLRILDWGLHTLEKDILWGQLTRVETTISSIDVKDFLHILACGKVLQSVRVYLENPRQMDEAVQVSTARYAPVENVTIREMDLECDGPQDDLFRALRLPNLTRLALSPLSESDGMRVLFNDFQVFSDFLGRVRGGLQEFALDYAHDQLEDMVRIQIFGLPQMSTLLNLRIRETAGGAGDDFFKALTIDSRGSAPLLPRLTSLRTSACTTTDGVISRMLQSRHTHRYPLRNIFLGYPCGTAVPQPRDAAAYDTLSAMGWEIGIEELPMPFSWSDQESVWE